MSVEDYELILAKLDDAPSLVRRPLPASEIDALEREVGVKMPAGVRAWLSKVGLFEDISTVDAGDFELHTKPDDLVDSRQYILELLEDGGKDLFPFGHDGAGDEIAVRTNSGGHDVIMFVDHETRTANVQGPFEKWLRDVVDEAVTRAAEEGDVQKFWCVQFAFETADEKPILAALETVAPVKVPDNIWYEKKLSPAGVRPAKLGFVFLGQARLLSRSTYKGWSSPHFSFDYEEPVTTPLAESTIRRLDEVFRGRPELHYKLVDYGPMEWPPSEEYEGSSETEPKKPWWKFW
jgi:hypothetical protein